MIQLTAAAIGRVKEILAQEQANLPDGGLRVYVQGGGCSGPRFGLVLDEANEGDRVFDQDGLKVIVDPQSLDYVSGVEVDFRPDAQGGGFAVKNPHAAQGCHCAHASACAESQPEGD